MKNTKTVVGVQEAVQGFLFSQQAEGRTKRTYEYYQEHLKHFLNYCREQGWHNLESIDGFHIRQFLSWVSNRTYSYTPGNGSHRITGPSSARAWPYYKCIRRMFNWTVEEGLLESSPMKDLRYKRPSQPPVQPYSKEEVKRFLEVCELDIRTEARFTGLRNKAIILLFIDSALRLSEMAGIRLDDLNLEQRLIRVVGKGNKVAFCPFSPKTAKAIVLYMTERNRRAKSDALWLTEEGRAFTAEGLGAWFTRLKQRAGITSPGGVHRLRHTAALQYLRSTKNSFYLQLYLRHEDLAMSRRYTRALTAEEAIEAHRNGGSPVEGLGLG